MRLSPDRERRLCPVRHGVCGLDLSEDVLGSLCSDTAPSWDLQGYGRSTWE